MKTGKYNMSFTTGGLFHQESVKIAALYFETGDWDKVRHEVMEKNILQVRTLSSSKRICREICFRLRTLHPSELKLLISGASQEQAYLLWLAVCRHYRFIRDFAIEVIRERFLTLRRDLNNEDYDAFFNAKAHWHQELEKITPATHKKLRQVLFRILREADLVAADNTINAAMLTPRLVNVIGGHAYQDFSVFPVAESELKELVR
ncbi:MAG: DUF1819 family protein [Syntrophobacteraceae bacterium]|jgi:hypothetical protein